MQSCVFSCFAFVLLLPSSFGSVDSVQCAEGFMEYELLQKKANQIPNRVGALSNNKLPGGKTYVLPSLSFDCAGTITGFFIGVDIRTDNGRNEIPWVGLFNYNNYYHYYTLVTDSKRYFTLNAENFSTNGLIQYNFDQPLHFEGNQMFGVYQPDNNDSKVTLFHYDMKGQNVYEIEEHAHWPWFTPHFYKTAQLENSAILFRPIMTTNTKCEIPDFVSFEEIQKVSKEITSVNGDHNKGHLFYKDIKFNCNGTITHVIIGAKNISVEQSSEPPKLQIWRCNNNNSEYYSPSGPFIPLHYHNATENISTEYVRWYNLSEPLAVQEGDLFGIYQPKDTTADSVIYYQRYSGPIHYQYNNNSKSDYNVYHLVSVIFEPYATINATTTAVTDTMTPFYQTKTTETTPNSIVITESHESSSHLSIVTSSVVKTHSSFDTQSSRKINESTQLSTRTSISVSHKLSVSPICASTTLVITSVNVNGTTTDNTNNIILGSVMTVIVLIVSIIVIVIVAIALFTRRKHNKTVEMKKQERNGNNGPVNMKNQNLVNPAYEATTQSLNYTLSQSCESEPNYSLVEESNIDSQDTNMENHYSVAEDVKTCNVIYTGEIESDQSDQVYNTLQFEMLVPDNAQREQLNDTNEDHIYEILNNQNKSVGRDTGFFTKEPIYWNPENDTKGIYEQLSNKKYREIPRKHIKITGQLGSGQFGTVDKGSWNIKNGSIEVAVKTLNGSNTEEDEIKFLQEAAINGQFSHPNVVKLYGVVTLGQPIMIVMEYLSRGNLKAFLEHKRPVCGELPECSLQAMMLKFSHQVACGMVYLSEKQFVHRDLAARNILVGEGNICKIADFGMSRDLNDEAYYRSNCRKIPVKWTAPEAIHYRKYTINSDVWSFGALLYEIWSLGRTPFEQYSNQECIQLVDSGYHLPSPFGCPKVIYELMINCWDPNVAARPTFKSLELKISLTVFQTDQ